MSKKLSKFKAGDIVEVVNTLFSSRSDLTHYERSILKFHNSNFVNTTNTANIFFGDVGVIVKEKLHGYDGHCAVMINNHFVLMFEPDLKKLS